MDLHSIQFSRRVLINKLAVSLATGDPGSTENGISLISCDPGKIEYLRPLRRSKVQVTPPLRAAPWTRRGWTSRTDGWDGRTGWSSPPKGALNTSISENVFFARGHIFSYQIRSCGLFIVLSRQVGMKEMVPRPCPGILVPQSILIWKVPALPVLS